MWAAQSRLGSGWFAVQAVSLHTFGVWIAVRGRAGSRGAVRHLVGLRIFYAVLGGVLVNATGWPLPLAKVSQVRANGSLSVLLLRLHCRRWSRVRRRRRSGATVGPLLVAPVIAWGTGLFIGLERAPARGCGDPGEHTGRALTAFWAAEVEARLGVVSATVVVSTLGSGARPTALMMFLVDAVPR